jgi:hypothetical protein
LSGEASLNGKLSLNPGQGAGVSVGASANADVLSASETLKMGPVKLTATGNVGVGAEASVSLSQDKGFEASAGLTDIVGGAVKIQIGGAGQTATVGASASIDKNGQTKTDIEKPKLK